MPWQQKVGDFFLLLGIAGLQWLVLKPEGLESEMQYILILFGIDFFIGEWGEGKLPRP